MAEVFPDEHIYRLGGDEFVVLAKLRGQVDLKALSARIVRAISKPLTIKGATVDLGASVGYTVAGINGGTLADAIHQSDCAMYASKKMGRNNASAFTPAMLDELN
ncbi:diguanylate cyclase domain-containing protein, partial [Agrobacterium pusense]|uniref:diguanylate cyclase domain-containing protein n=1 Tax=Agrobacterium pusense TaxID=648995 RepID=UPI0031F46C16